ncbi:hypothetical protein [Stutzerimonas nitrititolerans]|uniref:hypothetical protein n=1 Tax=Stutzerimonas nitrititolerans TaxID=2482751 RepID=UPI0028A15070|nr:hypothetical protein [Stutzerimonas nitrititolerans]
MTLPRHPSHLRTDSFLHNEKKLVVAYSQQVVDEYMNNPLAPIRLYRPSAVKIEGTMYLMWSKYDPHSCCWDIIESSLNKRVHSNFFRRADPAERKLLTATERQLALLREILECLNTAQDAIKCLSEFEKSDE